MANKNVYFYKVSLFETVSHKELSIAKIAPLINQILAENMKNNAIFLSDTGERMVMDIIERTESSIFARLSKKRRNNSVQRRNYNSLQTAPVLSSEEEVHNGIELFTYCILGYTHGILSIAISLGAPNENSLNRLFTLYNNDYYFKIESVPNASLINELYNAANPEINKITLELPTPNVQMLEQILGVNDQEILQVVQQKTNSIVFEIKPELRSSLCNDARIIKRIIDTCRAAKGFWKKAILDGKPKSGMRQRSYDLYEEYFKYSIDISEDHVVDGNKVEYPKETIEREYKQKMTSIYDEYKELILGVCNRL